MCVQLKFSLHPTGTWLKSGLGLVHQEGSQRTWTYIAPQLGYWVAAMSPPNPGNMKPIPVVVGIGFFLLFFFLRVPAKYAFENYIRREITSYSEMVEKGTWLAQLAEHVTLDLRITNSSPTHWAERLLFKKLKV